MLGINALPLTSDITSSNLRVVCLLDAFGMGCFVIFPSMHAGHFGKPCCSSFELTPLSLSLAAKVRSAVIPA